MPEFDTDIEALALDWGEKSGLQMYRNYTSAFEKHAVAALVTELDNEPLDMEPYGRLAASLVAEEVRFLPIIVCAYAEELLTGAFKAALPDGIPGGKAALFGSYGPLSTLANLIKMAYAFDVVSPDLMVELNALRSARNKVSHSWDVASLADLLNSDGLATMHRTEELLLSDVRLEGRLTSELTPDQAFRVRLIWFAGRLLYECLAYHRAKAARLPPSIVLYRSPRPMKWLKAISSVALAHSIALTV